ncbi:MAG: DUF459 domain-containing protein [Bradyrhizobium sp.]|nr:MAG: DUF459 domain-containing protein [Bradyrhizobium sp.]
MVKTRISIATLCVGFVCAMLGGGPGSARADEPAKIHIAFVGDSMADGLWGAMFRRLGKDKCLADKIKLIRRAKNGTGLTRLDQFNWIDEVNAIATDPGADLFVGSFGVNDRQSIVDVNKKRTEFGGPAYDSRYQGVVEDVIQAALSHDSSMLIMGLPVMLDPAASADATEKNKIFADAVAHVASPRAVFAPPWMSQPGTDFYQPFLPNGNKAEVQVRAPDGVHFTTFGYDLVMNAFYPAILDSLKQRGRDVAAECDILGAK